MTHAQRRQTTIEIMVQEMIKTIAPLQAAICEDGVNVIEVPSDYFREIGVEKTTQITSLSFVEHEMAIEIWKRSDKKAPKPKGPCSLFLKESHVEELADTIQQHRRHSASKDS